MESQDLENSPTVIPCSEEMTVEDNASVLIRSSEDVEQNSENVSQSQSLLANSDNNTIVQDEEISSINVSTISKTKVVDISSVQRNSASNSVMDLESSDLNPMSSTRIEQDNSMSLLNEGFMIDSASLSLSAVNDDSRLGNKGAETNQTVNDNEEVEATEIELESELMEDDSEDLQSASSKRKAPVESDEDDDAENSVEYPVPQFPMARVKKIMSICAAAEEDEINEDNDGSKSKKGKGNIMITKEAIYLTTLATEHFISVIGKMAGNVTASTKKKTLTLEHLKRALSDTDAFAFLEGCFQPSVIIGD